MVNHMDVEDLLRPTDHQLPQAQHPLSVFVAAVDAGSDGARGWRGSGRRTHSSRSWARATDASNASPTKVYAPQSQTADPMASALEMPIREEDESDARYARLSDPGEPSGLALLCPCLRRAPAYERVEEATPNPLAAQPGDAARDDDPHRGSWLDEADELAASCFACSSAFHPVKNRRHHCRRCGDTYCIGCSSRYQPLLLSGCLLYTSPSPRDGLLSRMPSSA